MKRIKEILFPPKVAVGICVGKGVLWVLIWFGFMLLYTALDVTVWRNINPLYGKYLNLFSIILCMVVFLLLLTKKITSRLIC